ncbi:MAG: DUF523 and DUF1722 domain-containing protein [Hydrogenothermaceae bacterium]
MYRPKVVISRCINIASVRYNGGIVVDEFAKRLGQFVDYVDICPEVDIGMPVPRPSVLLARFPDKIKMIEPISKIDYTEKIEDYSKRVMESFKDIDGFLLKSKSPSCGVGDTKLYKEDLVHSIGKTDGIFARFAKTYFPYLPVEDEGRLHDIWIKRDFLTKIFRFAEARNAFPKINSINELIKFHQNNKYLLMLYSPSKQKKLGQIIANWDKIGLEETVNQYRDLFYQSLLKRPGLKSHINVLQHIYGHFSEFLKPSEKRHIHNLLNRALNGSIDIKAVVEYIKGFVFRFDDEYLKNQTYLFPYPQELD